MKRIAFLFVILPGWLWGQDKKYSVDNIPAELKVKANVVIREMEETHLVKSKSKAIYTVKKAITILNGKGKQYGFARVGYDKLIKVTSFKGSAYDATGKLIKKLKNSEIFDMSSFDGYSLFTDNRFKYADLTQSIYPYTIELEYELEYSYLYNLSFGFVISGEGVSVQSSTYQLIYPIELRPRYKVLNSNVDPVLKVLNDGQEGLVWEFENIPPIEVEPLGPRYQEVFPCILAAPSAFSYEGYEGDMSSWKSLGEWEAKLLINRDIIPDDTRKKVHELTKDLINIEQKAKVLYEFMQSKTRYVSIQLGIGGLQPFEASVVDKNGYGDCKALSNYMIAILKEAGIKGYYASIFAGNDVPSVQLDFPSHLGNHVIVAVPNGQDTIWLECTSQTIPFGYLGSSTDDRKALLVTEEGGRIANTTRYSADINVQSRSAFVIVELTGDAKATVKTTYSGLQYENEGLASVLNDQFDEQKKWVQYTTEIPSFDLNSFSMTNVKDKIPSAIVNLHLNLKKYATVSGKRTFLNPNLMNRSTFIPDKVENRKTKVIKDIGFIDLDTIRFHLPENIYPEFMPEPVKLKSRFGEYEASYQLDQGQLLYIRRVKMNKGEFPPETYDELVSFYRNMNKADQTKVVFLSKT